jgi:hypothetical protein
MEGQNQTPEPMRPLTADDIAAAKMAKEELLKKLLDGATIAVSLERMDDVENLSGWCFRLECTNDQVILPKKKLFAPTLMDSWNLAGATLGVSQLPSHLEKEGARAVDKVSRPPRAVGKQKEYANGVIRKMYFRVLARGAHGASVADMLSFCRLEDDKDLVDEHGNRPSNHLVIKGMKSMVDRGWVIRVFKPGGRGQRGQGSYQYYAKENVPHAPKKDDVTQ